jgi:hypothetical protein
MIPGRARRYAATDEFSNEEKSGGLPTTLNGKERRESSKSASPKDARRLLKERFKQIHGGRYIGPSEERLTVDQLLDSLITHLETRGAKTVERLKSHLKPLRNFFTLDKAVNVRTADVERYVADRLKARKARATVNRETGALKQAFNLARKQGSLTRVPYIPMLHEDNARQGSSNTPISKRSWRDCRIRSTTSHDLDTSRGGVVERLCRFVGMRWTARCVKSGCERRRTGWGACFRSKGSCGLSSNGDGPLEPSNRRTEQQRSVS